MSEMTEIVEDVEQYFPPRPGGAVDTARKQRAAQQPGEAPAIAEPRRARPVPVKTRQPDLWGAKTISIAAGVSAMAMPADPNRKHGQLNLITATSTVIVARDRAGADTGTGYTLETANPPLEVHHTREVWLSNPGGAAVQVSVLTESYAD